MNELLDLLDDLLEEMEDDGELTLNEATRPVLKRLRRRVRQALRGDEGDVLVEMDPADVPLVRLLLAAVRARL